jgi:hypothetical protein
MNNPPPQQLRMAQGQLAPGVSEPSLGLPLVLA